MGSSFSTLNPNSRHFTPSAIHPPFQPPDMTYPTMVASATMSDVDSFSNFSGSVAEQSFTPFGDEMPGVRKQTYHPGTNFGFFEGEHTLQFLMAQQAHMLDDIGARKKSHSFVTPGYRVPWGVGLARTAGDDLVQLTNKKLSELESSAQGFGDDQSSCRFLQDMLDGSDEKLQALIKKKVGLFHSYP